MDAGQPGEFFYAEIEYPTTDAALAWQPGTPALRAYLADEVTGRPAPAWANTGCAPAAKPSDPACRARPTARREKSAVSPVA